jgi:hypothetical protein
MPLSQMRWEGPETLILEPGELPVFDKHPVTYEE